MQNKKIVPAKEYEQRIPLLLSDHKEGRVHSVFQNGVNVEAGGRLFFIGTEKNGQLPFGIHIHAEMLQPIVAFAEQGAPVLWCSELQQIQFQDAPIIVSLTEAVPFHWELPHRELGAEETKHNLALLIAILLEEGKKTGLDVDIEYFLMSMNTDDRVKDLLGILLTEEEQQIEQALRTYIGRGQGLTPSGDDHLVGILAIHQAVGLLTDTAFNVLQRLVADERLTTDVGREYLLYALRGNFSSTVVKPASELTGKTDMNTLRPLIEELLDMGHSSGIDTIFGMLLGLLMHRRNLECQKKY